MKKLIIIALALLALLVFASCKKEDTSTECQHNIVTDSAIAATCTETGLTEGSHCSLCNEILVAQETIKALGHNEETISGHDATCTEDGLTSGKKCSACGITTVEQTIISATGHTEATDTAIAPTCTETGLTEGSHCSVCNTVLIVQEVIDALGHTQATAIEENRVEPTCTANGSYDSVVCCSVCSAEMNRTTNTIDTLGHDEIQYEAQAPTCTTIGWDNYVTCTRCDHTTYQEIAATGHETTSNEAQAPTCTAIGWESYETCSKCDYTTYSEIPATGHDYSEEYQAIEGTPGIIKHTCNTCSDMHDTDVSAITGNIKNTGSGSIWSTSGSYTYKKYEVTASGGYGRLTYKYELYSSSISASPFSTLDFTHNNEIQIKNPYNGMVIKVTIQDSVGNTHTIQLTIS